MKTYFQMYVLRHTSGSNNTFHKIRDSIVFQHSLSLSSRTGCPRHEVELDVSMIILRGGRTEFLICNCSGTQTWPEKGNWVQQKHGNFWGAQWIMGRTQSQVIPLVIWNIGGKKNHQGSAAGLS